jgi:hypothetical protein
MSFIKNLVREVFNMKRRINFLMAALMLTSCFAQGVYANTVVAPASAGVIKSDRMLISVPSGEIFKLLGFDVNINGDTVTIKDSDHTVVLKNGESTFTTDGKAVTPDVPQQRISDSYYIPVRAIAESVGATVEWKADTKTAIITYKGKSISVKRNLIFGNDIYNAYLAQIKYEQGLLSGDSKYDSMWKYSIYDIDNDGVPELIIYIGDELTYSAYKAPHAYVYKFENGKAVECGSNMKGTLRLYEYTGKNAVISELSDGEYKAYIISSESDGNKYIVPDSSSDKPVVGNEIPQYSITDVSGLDVLAVFSVISENKV